MKNLEFGVTSTDRRIVEAFMHYAEKQGISYNEKFISLEKSLHYKDLYFSRDWRFEQGEAQMSFTNATSPISLDSKEGWEEALDKLNKFINAPRKMTLKEIEDELGYKIDLIV